MRYTLQNGYTKKLMKRYINDYNTGKRCHTLNRFGNDQNFYNKGNNHCSVGCFVPHGHKGMEYNGDVSNLLTEFPELATIMPLRVDGMNDLQMTHDDYTGGGDIRVYLCEWIEENVE